MESRERGTMTVRSEEEGKHKVETTRVGEGRVEQNDKNRGNVYFFVNFNREERKWGYERRQVIL